MFVCLPLMICAGHIAAHKGYTVITIMGIFQFTTSN